ncbi:hypothetical protein BDV32DRAFT_63168 [Aspergillus pseudonomiae]|nr:hypothetical protein BDV32DRAFT_63168 [Aspergillus pseudonomiae]
MHRTPCCSDSSFHHSLSKKNPTHLTHLHPLPPFYISHTSFTMAWGWQESEEAHRRMQEPEKHEGHLSHELIAGAASFAGMKAWEDHQRKEGKPVSHAFAKEALAGFVGSQVDRLIETKGRDKFDEIKAKKHAKENAERMYDEHYVQGQNAPEYNPNEHRRHEAFDRW